MEGKAVMQMVMEGTVLRGENKLITIENWKEKKNEGHIVSSLLTKKCRYSSTHFVVLEAMKNAAYPMDIMQFEAMIAQQCQATRAIMQKQLSSLPQFGHHNPLVLYCLCHSLSSPLMELPPPPPPHHPSLPSSKGGWRIVERCLGLTRTAGPT